MSTVKPFQYDSIKAVLQYMEPNLRHQLSWRIPSIRNVNKLHPLKIDTVAFDVLQTRVNETTYRLGIYRQYPEGYEVPNEHRRVNENGGVNLDLTEHGLRVAHIKNEITPGDVDLSPGTNLPNEGRLIEDHLPMLELNVTAFRKALAARLNWGDENSMDSEICTLGTVLPNYRNEREIFLYVVQYSARRIREKLLDLEARLAPLLSRRNNTPLPFTPMIQLTIESPEGTNIFRHPYNMKLQQAMKKLNTGLFGSHNGVHRVRRLSILDPLMVIRLPVNLRLRVYSLETSVALQPLEPMIHESSYPLNMLTITSNFGGENHTHPIARNAKTLRVVFRDNNNVVGLPVLLNMTNRNLQFKCVFTCFPTLDQLQLMEHWITSDKGIGSSLCYEIENTPQLNGIVSLLQERYLGVPRHDNFAAISMRNGNRLEVLQVPLANPDNRRGAPKWRVEMRVVAGPQY
ncbi:unnamed protein product [Caenorhabditis brenneri]